MSTWESEMTPEDADTHKNNVVQLQRIEDFGDELDDWFAANRDQALHAIDLSLIHISEPTRPY